MSRSLLIAAVFLAATLPAPASAMPTRDRDRAPAQLTAGQLLTQAHTRRELLEHDPVGGLAPSAPAHHRSFPWIELVAAVALTGALVVTRRVRAPGRPAEVRR